jgi:hypothetical protein
VGAPNRKLVVNCDSAKPHIAQNVDEFFANNGMTKNPHPPYSSHLVPGDSFQFRDIRTKLTGRLLNVPDQPLMILDQVCVSIEKTILKIAPYKCGERLARSIEPVVYR